MTPEGKVKEWLMIQIKRRYGHLAVWAYAPPGGTFGTAGTMDRLLLIESGDGAPGVFVAIETKAEGRSLTPLQRKRLRDVDAAGGVAASLIGRDFLKLNRIFDEIDRRRDACRLAWRLMQASRPLTDKERTDIVEAMMEPNQIYQDLPFKRVE